MEVGGGFRVQSNDLSMTNCKLNAFVMKIKYSNQSTDLK